MKRHPLPALLTAALAAPLAAQAQNSATLYGLLDVGVEQVSRVGAGASSLTRVPTNTNTEPSRIGVRGSEDLGGGLRASFTLEMGIDPGNGLLNQGGRAWGRQAFVALGGPWGTVSLGRLYTMTFWSGLAADIHGGGIYGTGSLDSYLPNARADNAIGWRWSGSGFDLGATYSLGRDAVNAGPSPAGTNCAGESATDSRACREWSLMAKYDTKTWGVALANDRLHGRSVGAAPDAVFGGMNSSSKTDNRLIANGWFRAGSTKVGGGLIRRHNEGLAARPKTDLWHVGAVYTMSPQLDLSAQYVTLRYRNVAGWDSGLLSLRATYNLSRRTAVFAQVAQIDNDASAAVSVSGGAPGSNPTAGRSQSAWNVGFRHSF
jgi:predicted porin